MKNLHILYIPLMVGIASILGCASIQQAVPNVPPEVQNVQHKLKKMREEAGRKVVKWDPSALFFDDFNKYPLGVVAPFGPWKNINTDAHIEKGVQPDKSVGNILKAGDGILMLNYSFKYFTLEFNFKVEPLEKQLRVYFLLNGDATAGYYVDKDWGGSPVTLNKFAGSTQMQIAKSSGFEVGDDWNYGKIKVTPSSIEVYINGTKYIDMPNNDPSLQEGAIGLSRGGAYYDNIKITPVK